MKIYISGGITNNPNYKEDFERAENYLQREYPSAEVINPALVNSYLPKSTTHEEYMKMSFCMLDMCDSVYMLSNYEKSKGACMEYGYALAKDKKILFEEKKEQLGWILDIECECGKTIKVDTSRHNKVSCPNCFKVVFETGE